MSPVGGMTDGTILFTETALIKLYADQLGVRKKDGRELVPWGRIPNFFRWSKQVQNQVFCRA
jgi:hypothetical protein